MIRRFKLKIFKFLILTILALVLLNSCSTKRYGSEFEFANALAQKGLWKEAYFRWQKALEAGKDTPAIHNNMAIALEEMGKLEEAENEYKKALEMAPNNEQIKRNLERFQKKDSDITKPNEGSKKDSEKKEKSEK
jgi:Flp pilus assembly protein TadD